MAILGKYGKDRPAQSNESFIGGALTGDTGPETGPVYQNTSTSKGIKDYPCGRPQQIIKTAVPLDNVGKVYGRPQTSIFNTDWTGAVDNLKHSLTGSSAVNEEVGAAGPVKHVIVPWH